MSRRTISRDIETLCRAGIPIRTVQGAGGGISIMEGYRMDRILLTSKDMQMILAGLRSLDSVSGSRYYEQLMEKLKPDFLPGRRRCRSRRKKRPGRRGRRKKNRRKESYMTFDYKKEYKEFYLPIPSK